MKHKMKILWMFVFIVIGISNVFAQNVELLYTRTAFNMAMDYKEVLTVESLNNTNALSLNNISDVRKDAYLNKIASVTAVVILGETGVKAVKTIDFPMPVVLVDASGETAAKGPVISVFGADTPAPGGNPVVVATVDDVTLSANQLQDGAHSIFQCQGISSAEIVNKLLMEIKNLGGN